MHRKPTRPNVRDVLSNLRKLVGEHLEITRETVTFRRDVPYFLDVEEFSALIERYRRNREDTSVLEKAVDLYHGDFLEGVFVQESDAYESWQTLEREQLQQAQGAALHVLAIRHAEQLDIRTGLDYASRLLEMDALNEPGIRLRLGLLTLVGQRNEALAQYEAFGRRLYDELGVSPLDETVSLVDQIRSGEFEAAAWLARTSASPSPYFRRSSAGWNRVGDMQLGASAVAAPKLGARVDWGDMPGQTQLVGREDPLQQLSTWSADRDCHLIAVTGMGGVGKSALVAGFARRLADTTPLTLDSQPKTRPASRFDVIVWRSLINTPPLSSLLRDCLTAVYGPEAVNTPDTISEQLALLRTALQERNLLLILDNFESILSGPDHDGDYRPEFAEFIQLVQLFVRGEHGSCLVITAREVPADLAGQLRDSAHTRHLPLSGLSDVVGIHFLKSRGLVADEPDLGVLVRRYSGNPLALKLVGDTAIGLLGGDLTMLLEDAVVFGDIRDVLDQQFARLNAIEKKVINWLAILREPATPSAVWSVLSSRPPKGRFIEAFQSLARRSLLEQVMSPQSTEPGAHAYTLQNVVMEYVTGRINEAVLDEIATGDVRILQRYGLVLGNAREFVQASQRRLLVEPVAERLVDQWGQTGAARILQQLLARVRVNPKPATGYTAANILELLVASGEDVQGYDFSHLTMRNADLRTVNLRGASFRGADLSGSTFRDTFDLVLSVRFTADGKNLVARSSDGSIGMWQLNAYQPVQVLARNLGVDLCMALSPKGILAAGSGGHVIALYNLDSGREVDRLSLHDDQIIDLCFCQQGNRLVSSSLDGSVAFWSMDEQPTLLTRTASDTVIYTLGSSHDGTIVAAGGYDGSVTLYDADSGRLVQRFAAQSRRKVRAVAFSSDDRTLAAASEDGRIYLWDVANAACIGMLTGHTDAVLALAFHPDGETLASGGGDKTIRLWKWREQELQRVFLGSAGWVTSLDYSPDGSLLASGGYDRTIRLWQHHSGHLLHTLVGSSKFVNQIASSPDGRFMASATFDQPICLWDLPTGQLLHELRGHSNAIRRMVFSIDGGLLATSGDGRGIRIWDTDSGYVRQVLERSEPYIRTLIFSPDASLLAAGVGTATGSVFLWDIETGQTLFSAPNATVGLELRLAFSPDGRLLAYGNEQGELHLVRTGDGSHACTARQHTALINSIAFSPTGNHLITQDSSGMVCIWQLSSDGTLRLERAVDVSGSNEDLWNLVISPDGRLVACQAAGPSIALLDIRTGQLRWSAGESLHSESSLAFTSGGTELISVAVDGKVRFREVADGRLLRTHGGQSGAVRRISIDRVHNQLIGSTDDGAIEVWDIASGERRLALRTPGPYEGMDITGATGLSAARVAMLQSLGAIVDR